ncbi:MAG: hypothetical protein K6E50_08885 [Lachnospiraceae bacterium]|nr:hypothetical protein [Lachnospiraceae bacterium]
MRSCVLRGAFVPFLTAALLLGGCTKTDKGGDRGQYDGEETTPTPETTPADPDPEPAPECHPVENATEADVLRFLAGEWKLADKMSGKDYAALSFSENGELRYERLSDGLQISGNISFQDGDYGFLAGDGRVDRFSLTLNDIPEEAFADSPGYVAFTAGDVSTSGVFYLGRSEGEDYLYLQEVGNGSTFISENVFRPENTEPGNGFRVWLLHRENEEETEAECRKDSIFYALGFATEEGGMVLEPVEEHSGLSMADYTDYPYLSCEFASAADGLASHYELAPDCDTVRVFYENCLSNPYPCRFYEVVTDKTGLVTALSDVTSAMYSDYMIAREDPEVSIDGLKVTIGYREYDMTEIAPPTNAILSWTRVGDYLVFEGHINPNLGTYSLYDLQKGEFEQVLYGYDLTWQGNDITRSVYADGTKVFDYEGHVVYETDQDRQIIGVEFSGDYKELYVSTCPLGEFDGDVDTVVTDAPAWDNLPMYAYLTYWKGFQGNPLNWLDFRELGPDDVSVFIMVDPPVEIYGEEIEKNALNSVAVVALQDNTLIRFDKGTVAPDESGMESVTQEGTTYTLMKGQMMFFEITVPEGLSQYGLQVEVPDEGKTAFWAVATMSGMTDQRCCFR